MNIKEKRPALEGGKDNQSTMTLQDLQALYERRQINLETSDYETYTGVDVSRGPSLSRYEWRKLTKRLSKIGFVHIGGGNPWYGSVKEGTWRGPPYWDEPLGIAIEESDGQGKVG